MGLIQNKKREMKFGIVKIIEPLDFKNNVNAEFTLNC